MAISSLGRAHSDKQISVRWSLSPVQWETGGIEIAYTRQTGGLGSIFSELQKRRSFIKLDWEWACGYTMALRKKLVVGADRWNGFAPDGRMRSKSGTQRGGAEEE